MTKFTKAIIFSLVVFIVSQCFILVNVLDSMNKSVVILQSTVMELTDTNKELISRMNEKESKGIKTIEEKKVIEKPAVKPLSLKKDISIDRYTDLGNKVNISEDDMNKIIKYWKADSPFNGKGHVFIRASKETGLDPIYLLAHAAVESGWGESKIAIQNNNYFGIAAYDNNPSHAYEMGSNLDEGIVNGAKWIKKEYYSNGLTTLNAMIYGGKMYASAKDKWINGIQSIMRQSYKVLNS